MFEHFLDNSIKQSEGQFFTPMPICKFILQSLPLEHIIKTSGNIPRVIDYACGAGHFLNEYASQIKPYVMQHTQIDIKQYYAEIYGIEKEDRLAKVAKVSAFMYGQDEINILDADALDEHQKIKLASFDILAANPPFAVEGFLETLPEHQRNTYSLIHKINNLSHNNIQSFFIERAEQILADGAIAGIILPSSILSNADNINIAAREIILKAFDIIAIAELGNNTFGKTGTNTIILFLRKKDKIPTQAEHYTNRVQDWFNGQIGGVEMEMYQDLGLIDKYCQHINIEFDNYKRLV